LTLLNLNILKLAYYSNIAYLYNESFGKIAYFKPSKADNEPLFSKSKFIMLQSRKKNYET